MAKQPAHQTNAEKTFGNQEWRLNNLYWITDKKGKQVKFRLKPAQEELLHEMHYNNVILKARQRGYTTFIDIFILDTCLFNSNTKAGIIAHHKDDAKVIFRDKIKFPYDNLPSAIRKEITAETDRAGEMVFSNGSSVRVATSIRSGTVQILHVSEYGKISAKYPDKAKEIKTGAFEAVGLGQLIFVESTAEGRGGEFYDLCHRAKSLFDGGRKLSELDFKFFFAPWYEEEEYRLDPSAVVWSHKYLSYFERLAARGIVLDDSQKAWYIAKAETHKEDMKREHPSYPEEAFEAAVEGTYYGDTISKLRQRRQICRVPYEKMFPVNTFWDLGMDDSMTIWFHQRIGTENRLINYIEDSGEGLAYYAKQLKDTGYFFGNHYFPHDVKVRELGTGKTRQAVAEGLGVKPIIAVPRPRNQAEVLDAIEATRNFLAACWIDEENCDQGIKCLENYRKEWDEKLASYKRTPLHNWASHGSDSLRTGATGFVVNTDIDSALLEPDALEAY